MNKVYWENKNIEVYWWNMGKKTLDFRGTYKDFLKEKEIKVTHILNGFRFKISLGTSVVILDTHYSDYFKDCDEAIQIYLTLLGDKAKFTAINREYYINWN